MTEHLKRAIKATEGVREGIEAENRWEPCNNLDPDEWVARAFTAALLEGLTPEQIVGAPSPTATDLGREYRSGMLDGVRATLDTIRWRAGLGGQDDPA